MQFWAKWVRFQKIPLPQQHYVHRVPLMPVKTKPVGRIFRILQFGPLEAKTRKTRIVSISFRTKNSRTKNQPKEEVFGTDIPRTSRGHSRGYPDPKLRSGRPKSWKNKHLGADIHDPKARTSTTLRDLQKLRSEKLGLNFRPLKIGV